MHTILYFASVREALNIDKEIIEERFENLQQLRHHLASRSERWSNILNQANICVAQNQQLCEWQDKLIENSEIAIFPPMTGG